MKGNVYILSKINIYNLLEVYVLIIFEINLSMK